MQCQLFVAFVAACLVMSVSAAPVAEFAGVRVAELPIARAPEPDRSALRLPRVSVEEAREPEPVPEPACSLYSCIW
ncbi:hypothetical protein DFH07DRAFT_965162 [Mycena maculata]|uniref:Secreted protein n=1 Tax=Mycena maculata TaxID=230809 RepID=A0AAD7IE06_9AGAR|nr:hypothetical protein DFH07DRAFT_965162 [Mycena maculata]